MRGHVVFCCAHFLLLILPTLAQADDADALRAAQESEIAALHSRNVDAYLASLHPEEVSMFAWEAFPVDYKGKREERRRAVETFFANLELLKITSINKGYRVIDTTGLVWGHVKIEMKTKDSPLQIRYYRGLWVYAKSGDEWLRVARHVSAIPQGN